jgi:hypothetical protein
LFRRVLENESARGYYVIGDGRHPTVAEITEAATVAAGAPGAVPGSDDEARARLGDYFAEVLLLDQGTDAARAKADLDWSHPNQDSSTSSATAATATGEAREHRARQETLDAIPRQSAFPAGSDVSERVDAPTRSRAASPLARRLTAGGVAPTTSPSLAG